MRMRNAIPASVVMAASMELADERRLRPLMSDATIKSCTTERTATAINDRLMTLRSMRCWMAPDQMDCATPRMPMTAAIAAYDP